ncbi:lipoate--protein ligase family protein [Poseidonocella sedimentorum]|uniref:BPL/LPL catalytic domain-containing protein n=1 Tax=Poseidonocella sedimentorum TaxID=871652 RepID=A0A1I6ELF6_9RHOB|nr:hypothetical protein [Poseidonocella sedimentorum]SFR18613.1 hypothetical protein SAMN04515673_11442 [Poseidonocella sedimentorum]
MSAALTMVRDVPAGLALEAQAFGGTGPQVRLWMAEAPALVCPAAFRRKPGFDAAARNAGSRGWPLHLRPTGGGAVPQGPGVLNLALAFAAGPGFSIEAGYRLITDVIRNALGPFGLCLTTGATPRSFCDGAWNLSARGRKLVGTAQRIRPTGGGRRRVLVHALLLTDCDLGPAALAVNGAHADLGLPPVSADAHTTLAHVLGPDAPEPTQLADSLSARAADALGPSPAIIAA